MLWVTAPKTPLKSPLVQGGTLFSSNVVPQRSMKTPLITPRFRDSSVIQPLHKPLLCVKVKIDSINHGFGIGNRLEGARFVRATGILY